MVGSSSSNNNTERAKERRKDLECIVGKENIQWAEKKIKKHHGAIDREGVLERYDGVVERFKVDGRVELSDALKERVEKLNGCYEQFAIIQVAQMLLDINSKAEKVPEFVVEKAPAKQLTWEDILAEEPLEGEHWEKVDYNEVDDDDEEEEESDELMENPDSDTSVEIDEDIANMTIEPLPKPIDSYILVNENQSEEFINESYWTVNEIFISESNVIRECLLVMLGQPCEMFDATTIQGYTVVTPRMIKKYNMAHLTSSILKSLLTKVGQFATIIGQLRQYTDSYFLTETTFKYKHVHGLIDQYVQNFDKELIKMQKEYLHTDVISLMQCVYKLEELVEPYIPLVEVLKSVSTQVELLDELYNVLYTEITSKSASLLQEVFMETLRDYKLEEFINHGYCTGEYFFIAETPGIDVSQYWTKALTVTSDPPLFIKQQTNIIYLSGKSSGFLKRLGYKTRNIFKIPKYTSLDNFITSLDTAITNSHDEITNNLSIYLFDNLHLKDVITKHFDTYFMLDTSGAMSEFLRRLQQHTYYNKVIDRFTLSEHVDESYTNSECPFTASLDNNNNKIILNIKMDRALVNIVPPHVAEMYQIVWEKLAGLSRTHASHVHLSSSSSSSWSNAAQISYKMQQLYIQILILVDKFWKKLEKNINVIDAHEQLVIEVNELVHKYS